MGGDRRPRALLLLLLLLLLDASLITGSLADVQTGRRHPPSFPAVVEEVAEVESDAHVAHVRRSLQVEVEPLHDGATHDHAGHDHADHDHDGHDHDGHGHDHDHDAHDGHDHDGHAKTAAEPASSGRVERFSLAVWLEALFATALVGAAPVVVLLFVPLGVGNQEAQQPLLRVFLSFAAGGLLGDALLHLLPHSLPAGAAHDHDHDHGHGHDHGAEGHSHSLADLSMWLWTLAGMLTFLMLEKFVRAQTSGGHGHSHGHSHGSAVVQDDSASSCSGRSLDGTATTARKRKGENKTAINDTELQDDASTSHPPAKEPIAAAGYLNLAADFTHNFTDGLAIGATFLRGSGWQTTLAMLLHELPHEIGDFAILIQSGFTRREAMLTQLLTAVGAMVGTVVGLLMEGAGDSSSVWISPFTAGGFIYIACASVMPELLEDCSLGQSLKEGVAMCVGIGLMTLIALSE